MTATDEPITLKKSDNYSRNRAKSFIIYAGKALVVVGLLFAVAQVIAYVPSAVVGIVWALLSAVSSIGLAYYAVVKKTHRQFMLRAGGSLSKINEGRAFRLIIAFVTSAVLMAGLLLSLPYWEWFQWLLLLAAIPLYFGISLLVEKVLTRQYESQFQTGRIVWWSGILCSLLLCLVYAIIAYSQPVPDFPSAEAALEAAVNPFAASPSALLSEAGGYLASAEAMRGFIQGQAAGLSTGVYLGWRLATVASALFGVVSLLGVCWLSLSEVKRIVLPLESAKQPTQAHRVIMRYVVLACVLPLVLIVGFVIANGQFEKVATSQEYHEVQEAVQEQTKIAAWVLDGKYYDAEAFQALMDEARSKSAALWSEGAESIEPLINAVVDKQLENVDPYLDWYYSLPADYERFAQIFTGTIEEGMKEQLESQINNGVDDTELMSQLESYMDEAEELNIWFQEELATCELVDLPAQQIVVTRELPDSFVLEPLAPSQKLLNAGSRMGVSTGTGIVAGFVTSAAVQKVIAKPFFSKIVTKITEILATRGLLSGAGTLIAPGVGTAVGIALGFAADFAILKIDEAMNRESYRAEIVDALEGQRSEWLALFQEDPAAA